MTLLSHEVFKPIKHGSQPPQNDPKPPKSASYANFVDGQTTEISPYKLRLKEVLSKNLQKPNICGRGGYNSWSNDVYFLNLHTVRPYTSRPRFAGFYK